MLLFSHEFGAIAGLHLQRCLDYFRCSRAVISLFDADGWYSGEDICRLSANENPQPTMPKMRCSSLVTLRRSILC